MPLCFLLYYIFTYVVVLLAEKSGLLNSRKVHGLEVGGVSLEPDGGLSH